MSTFVLENVGFRGWKEKPWEFFKLSSTDRLGTKIHIISTTYLAAFDAVEKIYPLGNNHISQYSNLGSWKIIDSSSWCRRSGDMWWFPGGHLHFNDSKVCFIFMSFLLQKKPYHSPHMLDIHFFFTMSCKADEAVDVGVNCPKLQMGTPFEGVFWLGSIIFQSFQENSPSLQLTGRFFHFEGAEWLLISGRVP